MSCNFYLRLPEPRPVEDFPGETTLQGQHIGKRSSAGPYCWDCGITIAWRANGPRGWLDDSRERWGQDAVHGGAQNFLTCPLCDGMPMSEDLSRSSSGRELGHNHEPPARKTGVRSASSFGFAWYPQDFRAQVLKHGVVDEYGDEMTGAAFLEHLAKDCPIRFWGLVGQTFS